MRIMATVSPMRLGGFRQAFLGIGVKPPYRLDVEQLLAIDEVTYAMSGVGLNGADYLIEIIAGDDEDLWRVVDESIRSLPGVDQTWWASTVSVEKSRTGSNLRRMVYFSTIDESMVLGASSLLILKDEMIIQTNA